MRVLYEADIGRQSLATVVRRVAHEVPDREQSFFRALSEGTWRERAQIDALLGGLTPKWSVDRLASTDRAILSLAIFELQLLGTPPRVVVYEAVGLAKAYGTEAQCQLCTRVMGALRWSRVGR